MGAASREDDAVRVVIPVRFGLEAEAEALDTFNWYEHRRPGLGVAFRSCLDAAILRVAENPHAFQLQYRDLRRVLVDRFPYAVYDRAYADVVLVVAVVHGRRHPRVWQRRA